MRQLSLGWLALGFACFLAACAPAATPGGLALGPDMEAGPAPGPAPTGNLADGGVDAEALPQGAVPGGVTPGFAVPLPAGDTPPREASVLRQWQVMGDRAFDFGGMAFQNPGEMVLPANPGQLSYAVYEVFGGAFAFDRIYYILSGLTVADNVWLGVSDYDRGGWRWQRYASGVDRVELAGFNARGAGGAAYLAVAVYDDALATVERVWLELDVPEWSAHPLALNSGMGKINGMATVHGSPALIFQDELGVDLYDLKYAYSTALLPADPTDWTITNVQSGYTGSVRALELIEAGGPVPGFAVIYDNYQLWYGYNISDTPTGELGWLYSNPDLAASGELGLALMYNNPAVVYEAHHPMGGTQVNYQRANVPEPVTADWDLVPVAGALNPAQDYTGLSLAAIQGELPAITFYDEVAQRLKYVSCPDSIPVSILGWVATAVDNPPLGGVTSAVAAWQGNTAIIYDAVNSILPRFAWPQVNHPAAPEEFGHRHQICPVPLSQPVARANGSMLGVAYRDAATNAVMFAWYSGAADAGPVSGGDWRVVVVDERPTSGEIGLCYMLGGIVAVCYHVDADDYLYFARMSPSG